MKILVLGKLSKNKEEVKSIVEDLGGKMTTTANKATLCISTQSEQPCLGYWEHWWQSWVDYRGYVSVELSGDQCLD